MGKQGTPGKWAMLLSGCVYCARCLQEYRGHLLALRMRSAPPGKGCWRLAASQTGSLGLAPCCCPELSVSSATALLR